MTHATTAQRRYVPGSSRGPRRAATLLAQMADLERGERIKGLRMGRHMTQPAVAEHVGVTLRAVQEWEAGGGLQWENLKRLSNLFGVEPEYVMRGEQAGSAIPDLFAVNELSPTDRIEAQLKANAEAIDDLARQMREMQAGLTANAAEAKQQIAEGVEAILQSLPPQRRTGTA